MNTGFLDIETGGFSTEKNGVCEVAVTVVDAALAVVDQFHCLIKPYTRPGSTELVSYKDDSMNIHGITVEELIADGLPVEQAMERLRTFCLKNGITRLIGHNIKSFDIPRLNYLMKRFAGASFDSIELVCTCEMARNKWPGMSSHKQEDLCAALGIPNPEGHRAIPDNMANIELYKILIS